MTEFATDWKPAKAATKLSSAQNALLPGEEVWFLGVCNNFKPLSSEIALTELRVTALNSQGVSFEAPYSEIKSFTANPKKRTIQVIRRDGDEMLFKLVPVGDFEAIERAYLRGASTEPRADLAAAHSDARAAVTAAATAVERAQEAKDREWANTKVLGKMSRKTRAAILRQCHGGVKPWLVLNSPAAGALVAFDDRLVIIKTGSLTSLAAGTLGGERTALFYFTDITGIEYNSGIFNGVLEILTPSYSGTANKDYWKGVGKSLNADSSNPFTLSNTLPLDKRQYNESIAEISEIRERVSRAKRPTPAAASGDDLAEQLKRIADLRDTGVLSDEEFAAAKARLLF